MNSNQVIVELNHTLRFIVCVLSVEVMGKEVVEKGPCNSGGRGG